MKLKHLLLLLMTVVSFSTTRAADDTTVVPTNWTKVAFNSDFRYSQWVINSRLGDFRGNSTQVGFTQYDGNGNIVGSEKTSKFDYVPGLVAKATLEARDLYKDFDWSKPWFYTVLNYGKAYTYTAKSASEQERKGLKGLTLDNMNAAKMYFGIAADALATSSDKTFSEEQIAGIITDMKLYNENWAIGGANSTNELGDAVAGGWFHKPEYVDQMWGDGLYMGSALLAQIINNKGASANVTDNDWDLITKQFRISWKYMYNETNGLLWHAFTANRTTAMNAGWEGVTADGSTYHSAAHWGRACGWYFLALVDVLEQMQIQITAGTLQKTDANYTELKNYVNLLAAGLARYQDDSGCWYQVLDEKVNPLAGNYLESSCTAIFTAAYLKGARLDLFGDKKNDYIAVAEKAYEGFVNNFMMRDANGDAQLIHCCASAGLGGSNKRSGSRGYYITGSDVTQRNTYTEGKVLGGFILAATEYERLHANDTPVLLTLDLHPECTLDGKTALEVAVSGDGTVKYQWFKDNELIYGAKEAKYVPTATGTYYCLITVTPATASPAKGRATQNSDGTYTIKSQETNVTVTAETGGGDDNADNIDDEYVLFYTDFTESVWNDVTTTSDKTSTTVTVSGKNITLKGYKNNGFYIENGKLYLPANNMGSDNYFVAIPVNNINGSVTIEIVGADNSRFRYVVGAENQSTPGSNYSQTTVQTGGLSVAEVITSQTNANIFIGGQSSSYKEISSIKITTPSSERTFTVEYELNGHGDAIDAVFGVTALPSVLPSPTADGYIFCGWYTDEAFQHEAVPGTQITSNVTLYAKWQSCAATATFDKGTLNGEVLTINHASDEAGSSQTINVSPAAGATCAVKSGDATLSGNTLSYTAPTAGDSKEIVLAVTAEDGTTTKDYTINVSTKAPAGPVTIGNATFSLDELRGFGTRSDKGEVTVLTKENVTLTATENGVIEGGQTGTNGTKVKSGAGFTITPNNGVRITKITIVTDNTGRWFTATPTQEGEMKRTDKTYEYSFNSIDQAVTFMNNSGNNLYANRIIVEYEKSVEGGKTILSASFDKEELVFYMKDDIPSLPVLSVTAGGQSVASNLYDVKYTSSNTSVVTIDETGVLALPEGNIAGSAVINAEIHPKNSDTYVGSEAFYTVTVKPLDIPTVYVHDITVYNTAGMQPEPVVDVYVKDEAGRSISLPKDYYTLAYTQQSGDAILISDKTGKFILAGEAGNWTTGSAVVRVEFNPTDDARQHYHITDTYVDFNVHVVTAGARLIPEIGGVSEARMQISDNKSERSFVTPVLYDGVDISTGFTFKYTLRDANNTGSKFQNAASDGSVTSKGDGYVTLLSGMTAGTVYIDITATPDENYKSQYNEVTKAIRVTVADLKRYNSVTITPSSITAKVGDVLQGFDIVVRDEHDNIVSEDDYTMFWGSSAPGVVAIAGNRGAGVFNAVAAGKAIVRVFVTDKAGEYSDRKGECTVTVIDDGTFKVTPEKIAELTGDKYDSSKENYGITASKLKGLELSVLDGLSVVLGGWMFPNSVKGSHGTTTETLGGAQWGAPTSKYRKPLGFTHNIHMGDQKNARQEYGSNCQPESNCIYDKTLTEVNDGFRLMDPMFNVPCSGSYLAFYPKTTGTVTVYIRQNGVFDNQAKNEVTTCVYRPQRRVFVIDEMGNFVSSTPKLEYPTTWNDNGLDTDGTKYTCDILGNSSEETKIYDLAKNDVTITGSTDKEKVQNWVKKHFEGLKTFDIAPDKFQNGVYASNLDNDITHNNAQLNHSGDRAAKGWCVLTAAPVSYKFNVKAGKTYYLYNYGSKLGLFGFTFRPTDFVVDEKTWSQTSETNSPEKTPDDHVAKVSIPDRTFPAGIWSACVLPFSMNRIQVNNVFGDCYDKNNLEGTQILYFDRVENGVIYFRRHAYNTIVAGKPFLIKPTKEAVISSENMGTKFPYVTIEAETPQAEWGRTGSNVDENYKWVSSYNKLAVVKGAHYINSDGGLSLYTRDDNAKMNGFRGYLKPKTAQAASKVLKLAYDSNIDGDGEATPIEGLVMDREGNLLEVPTSGVVYNLSGQVVTRDADKLYTLPAGIYIVNGKKYIVR